MIQRMRAVFLRGLFSYRSRPPLQVGIAHGAVKIDDRDIIAIAAEMIIDPAELEAIAEKVTR